MPQLKMYTGKILRTTTDAREIRKFLKDNELEERQGPNEIIQIRIYSSRIGAPPDSNNKSNLDADLLNYGSPIVLTKIFVKDLIEFGAYTTKEPKNGHTILSNLYVEEVMERIHKDPFKPILPIRHYFVKSKSILSKKSIAISVGMIGIIVTIVMTIIFNVMNINLAIGVIGIIVTIVMAIIFK